MIALFVLWRFGVGCLSLFCYLGGNCVFLSLFRLCCGIVNVFVVVVCVCVLFGLFVVAFVVCVSCLFCFCFFLLVLWFECVLFAFVFVCCF